MKKLHYLTDIQDIRYFRELNHGIEMQNIQYITRHRADIARNTFA